MHPRAPRMALVIDPLPNPTIERLRALEEKFKAMEVHNTPRLYTMDMCLVLGIIIPQNFKVPHFEKYKGVICPRTHLGAYCRKMAAYADDDSLRGASLEWYMQLEKNHIKSWRNLVEVFLKHYQYNTDMVPNRTQLQDMSQWRN